jgi:hypothetical protein
LPRPLTAEVEALPRDPLPCIAEVEAVPLDPLPAEVEVLPRHASPRTLAAEFKALPLDPLPYIVEVLEAGEPLGILDNAPGACATRSTPPAPNPKRDAPEPPAGDLRIIIRGIGHQACRQGVPLRAEPEMPRMQITFVGEPGRMLGGAVRVGGQAPPDVTQMAIQIIDRFNPWGMRAGEEHREGARKGFHVIPDVAQPLPD